MGIFRCFGFTGEVMMLMTLDLLIKVAVYMKINLCNIGWPIPKPLTFTALHYQV